MAEILAIYTYDIATTTPKCSLNILVNDAQKTSYIQLTDVNDGTEKVTTKGFKISCAMGVLSSRPHEILSSYFATFTSSLYRKDDLPF